MPFIIGNAARLKPIERQPMLNIKDNKQQVNPDLKQDLNAVICAIALNEDLYIDEWIQYYLRLGFTHIYIYDNSDNNSLKGKQSSSVTVIHYPGKAKQCQAYSTFFKSFALKHKWIAILDCDEFIVLKKHNSIIEFLKAYDDCDSIGLSWKMFGTSNEVEYKNEPVTHRFKYCSKESNIHIKCIIKSSYVNSINSPHFANLKSGCTNKDTSRCVLSGPFNPNPKYDIACIHHYWTKSENEFKLKLERGRSDVNTKRSLTELNNIHSKNNDVLNIDALKFS
jgi:hypothetical protein